MHTAELAICLAARGHPKALILLINTLTFKGYSVNRLVNFGSKHYGIPKHCIREMITSILIH
jgi:hypothetical protein